VSIPERSDTNLIFDEEVFDFIRDSKPDMLDILRPENSLLPYFPGYEFKNGKSTYRGEDVGEGGYVYAEPGIYGNVALLDIASMHPNSLISECLFGPHFTAIFKQLVDARIAIKHKDYDKARLMFDGKLSKYLTDDKSAKELSQALKIAINSVYGLTAAKFENPFKDPRNIDNIVAKRGALFMIDLKHEVQSRGFKVAHIKTDSIKIPDATPGIIDFVMEFGRQYGYEFEHEATYDRLCLVNDAVYIAKDASDGHWTATGTQFQVPYVFKKLFSKEEIQFDDMCETKAVSTALYLDNNEPIIMRIYEDLDSLEAYIPKADALVDEASFEKALNKLSDKYKEEDLHNYKFVGKVGRFCPIKIGNDGGLLVRKKNDKYDAVSGTKGYRWVESWLIDESEEYDKIDRSYYDVLCNNAIDTINMYGDYEWFVSDDPYISPKFENGHPIYPTEVPFL
jgi:hypothetical protein